MENVTAIRPDNAASARPRRRATNVRKIYLLNNPDEDGFNMHDVVAGLRGACTALDHLLVGQHYDDPDMTNDLCMAAKALSGLVASRIDE